MRHSFFPSINTFIESLGKNTLSNERQNLLQALVIYILGQIGNKQPIQLIFICTHNSRRSQMTEVWAQMAAQYFQIPAHCFSGGTVTSEVHSNTIRTLADTGFKISKSNGSNPKYKVYFSEQHQPIILTSKLYNDPLNPKEGFAAVMTCADADESCPIVLGATARIPVLYEDPGKWDHTELEKIKYSDLNIQIASEIFWVFEKVNEMLK